MNYNNGSTKEAYKCIDLLLIPSILISYIKLIVCIIFLFLFFIDSFSYRFRKNKKKTCTIMTVKNIVIVGGGYAGIQTANSLEKALTKSNDKDHRIILV